jgi:signal transduction histidine kinase
MDRKGKQKVRYILLALAAIVTVTAVFFFSTGFGAKIRAKQMRELVIVYPELENGLKDNFTYYQNIVSRLAIFAAAVVLLNILLLGWILVATEKRDKRLTVDEYENEYDLIFEQLLKFQKGDFELLPSVKESNVSGKAESVYQKLQELGYYFSDLKSRLTEEENNTKSLVTNISHQLKTPLASIRMYHELAGSENLSKEE